MAKLSRRRWAVVAAAVAVAMGAVLLGFGPLVRGRVEAAAARYGATVEIDWVLPAWGGVTLRGVRVRHADAPGIRVDLEEVRAGWAAPRSVEVRGGTVELRGSADELLAQVERVRAKLPKGSEPAGGERGRLSAERITVAYAGDGLDARISDARAERTDAGLSLGFAGARIRTSSIEVDVADGAAGLKREDAGWRVDDLRASAVDVRVDLGAAPAAAAEQAAAGGRGRIGALRSALERVDRHLSGAIGASGKVELEGVRASLRREGETLSLGPATIRAHRDQGRTVLEYLAGASARGSSTPGAEGLTVKTRVPAADEPLLVEVNGGPIALSGLGVRDGDFHLVDTDAASFRMNARLEVDPGAEVASFDGETDVTGLGFSHSDVAKDPVRGVKASFRGKVRLALDGSKVTVDAGELQVGGVRLTTSFAVTREPDPKAASKHRYKAEASYEVPLVPCQALIDAAPSGLFPTIQGMRLAGSFSLKGTARFDTARLDQDFDLRYDLSSTCRVTDVPPDVNVSRFKGPFKIAVYAPEGEKELELETGPGSGRWAAYSDISRFMELGAISFEDGRFHRHQGFDHEAIRNSIRENLRQGRFFRGASTISMQLAKNLYLSRDKRLSRKLEELFLTMYLEQELTKEQIMELYLNIVEFGPKVYGVEAAAQHYFHTSPSRLTISQAFYLASILPAPRAQHFTASGSVTPGWLNNIRTVMKYAHKVKRLSDEELEAGLSEIPLRGSPAPMRDPDAKSVPRDAGGEPEVAAPDVP